MVFPELATTGYVPPAYAADPGVPDDILTHRAVIRAWENAAYYVLANRLGREPAGEFVGGSVVAGPYGQILTGAYGRRDPVVRARLTARSLADARRDGDPFRDRRPDVYGDLRPAGADPDPIDPVPDGAGRPTRPPSGSA